MKREWMLSFGLILLMGGLGVATAQETDPATEQTPATALDAEDVDVSGIEQILRGEKELIAADMSNKKTNEANHNAADMSDLLGSFRKGRMKTVALVESLDGQDWSKSALHPRLHQPMRIVDILHFFCEHDDYHLGRIGELIRKFA